MSILIGADRAVIEAPEDISDRALMRRAKAEIGNQRKLGN